jgi:hypothetical protein
MSFPPEAIVLRAMIIVDEEDMKRIGAQYE